MHWLRQCSRHTFNQYMLYICIYTPTSIYKLFLLSKKKKGSLYSSLNISLISFQKSSHSLKVELLFIWWEFSGLQAWETASQENSTSTALRQWGEEPGYVEVLQQRAASQNIRRWLLMRRNQICNTKSRLIGKDPDAGKDWRQEEMGEDRRGDGRMAWLTHWTRV